MSDSMQPPPGPPPPPAGGAGYGATPQNGMGTAALIFGILQFFCLGIIGSILAVVLGKIGMDKADQGLANNRGVAKAGFVLGIIGLVLSAIALVIWVILIATGALNTTVEYSSP